MKKLLLLVTLMFLLTPATISADDERIGELESQIERLEKLIEDLTTENEELKAENEELRLQLENENGVDEQVLEDIKEVTDITEIYFNTDEGEYKIEEMFILPEGQPDSSEHPALLVLYEVTVKEADSQSNNLFVYDIYLYQDYEISYKQLYNDTIQFYLTDYPEYFEHNFEIIRKGATIKNASLYLLEDTEAPVIFEANSYGGEGYGYKIDLDEIEVKERSN